MEKKRLDNLDLLKAIAIIMVISAHIPLFDCDFIEGDSSLVIQYFIKLCFEGVPIFLFVNGYLLLRKDEIDLKRHYFKTLKIFMLMIVWSIILICLNRLYDNLYINRSIIVDLILKIGEDDALYVKEFWFLQYLIPVYLVYPLLWEVFKNNKKIFNGIFVAMLFFTAGINVLNLLLNYISSPIRHEILLNIINFLERFDFMGGCKWYMFYFALGGIVLENKEYILNNKNKFIIIGFASWALACVYGCFTSKLFNSLYNEYYVAYSAFMPFIVIGLFVLTYKYRSKGIFGKIIKLISINTFNIYIIHSYIIRLIRPLLPQDIFMGRLGVLLIVLAISFLISYIIKKIPVIRKVSSL